ncbi:MAG: Eco57I restriction-modification methylase domain-containing protein [Defluviitaleaceae bacterium]|nr:Eco57I restriction-modification methylase domain-containing protein [Defluviitaleaceae bacterium]
MDIKQRLLEETFENRFSPEQFLRFSMEFFGGIKIIIPYKDITNIPNEYKYTVESYRHMASYTHDKETLDVFAVKLQSGRGRTVERARSMQRSFISKLLSSSNHEAAIAAFYTDDDPRWRLSFVRLDYEFAAGRVKMNLTPAKRYSYLVGENEPCHTAKEQLFPIFRNDEYKPTLDRIEEAFSVEKVTKDFFGEYREKYFDLKDHLDSSEIFNEEAARCGFTSEQFAKKLMGQLAFLYFLQKKGWLGISVLPHKLSKKEFDNAFYAKHAGRAPREIIPKIYAHISPDEYKLNPEALASLTDEEADIAAGCFKAQTPDWGNGEKRFVRRLFSTCKKRGLNFFDEYLAPLFYEALNEKRGNNNFYKRFNCKIPFLNGGLFEPLRGHSGWRFSKFEIPNDIFSNTDEKGERNADGILDIFDRYNFTMNEDEPLEREVAVDPEMLGKIFENLLDTKDRKSKGAFYTPREIVHYMCAESLINYLVGKTGVPYDDMKIFIVDGEFLKDEDYFSKPDERKLPQPIFDKLDEIDHALATIKVADPAVGSGAFPLGMLSEIVKARITISFYKAGKIRYSYEELKKQKYERGQVFARYNPHRLKMDTIRNSIFAVDIEASAVDIAKLRLWLSLVVEEDLTLTEDEFLSGMAKKDPHPLPNLDYNIMCGNSLIDEFEGVQLFDDSLLGKKATPGNEDYTQMSMLADNMQFFLDDLRREQERLFSEQTPSVKREIKNKIDKIIDNVIRAKLERDSNSDGLHKYEESLTQKTKPYLLWKLEFARVFRENGGFDVVIGNPPYVLLQDITKDKKIIENYKKKYAVAKYKVDLYHLFIERAFHLLKENGINSYIVPSNFTTNNYCDELRKFLLTNSSVKNIIFYDENVFDANVNNLVYIAKYSRKQNSLIEICKAKIEGSTWYYYDIIMQPQRDLMKNSHLIVIATDESGLISKIEIASPILKSFAKVNFGMQLRDRKKYPSDVLDNDSCLTEFHKKCYTGKNIDRYIVSFGGLYCYFNRAEAKCGGCWDETAHFSVPKILVRQIGAYPIAGMDMSGFAVLNTAFMITLKCSDLSVFALLGIINSKMMKYYWQNKFMDNRKQFPKIKGTYLEQLPIKINPALCESISCVVNKIISQKQSNPSTDTTPLETEIDRLVYELYGLNEDEIKIVEGSV